MVTIALSFRWLRRLLLGLTLLRANSHFIPAVFPLLSPSEGLFADLTVLGRKIVRITETF